MEYSIVPSQGKDSGRNLWESQVQSCSKPRSLPFGKIHDFAVVSGQQGTLELQSLDFSAAGEPLHNVEVVDKGGQGCGIA